MKNKVFESNINRILSHMDNKDIAMITAYRTDGRRTVKENEAENKKLEADLNTLGYKGYIKIAGYWNETPEIEDSIPQKEETFLVLNVGNNTFEEFFNDMTGLQIKYDQQGITIWDHKNKKAYLTNESGDIVLTFSNFSIDTLSNAWSQIKNHKITFTESYDNKDFSDKFNNGGNWMTAMGYQAHRKSLRDNKN